MTDDYVYGITNSYCESSSIDKPVSRTVWDTCVHSGDGFTLVKEAEQVHILEHHSPTDGKLFYHVSVQVDGWFQCKTLSYGQYSRMTEPELMAFVAKELKDLESIARM